MPYAEAAISAREWRVSVRIGSTGRAAARADAIMSPMPITTEVYQRETSQGPETVTVMASIDGDGSEIRVIHERDGSVVADTIPHWGDDPAAGRAWVEQHRDSLTADGYRLAPGG
ncbi:hypothetical protein GCM10010168_21910 [Actinoplanes ianthinogenes]|uniref:Uncharacterized protein n=1 Tax=Actinoplanes ianthinogenes TaxID=122358 RepID=A0ABN6CRL5_9ACTN|nr:hypothetical protein [Actinoplanes ianthinogenes]BCJ47832.1 hypothetical protein Aiant_84890 [Actinoplanes ianthinogenes]GGR04476.1 hypothetical protein GCM10010168_21910 [Actinoplanes ianthinogenes]